MSIKGSPAGWFEAAVRRGDLGAALAEASAMPRPLNPAYTLALVVLTGEASDPRHGRWAARWAAQLTLQQPTVDLAVLGELVELLEHPDGLAGQPRLALLDLAARLGVDGANALLSPPSPTSRRAAPPASRVRAGVAARAGRAAR